MSGNGFYLAKGSFCQHRYALCDESEIPAFIALAAVRNGCEIRGVGLQYHVTEVDIRQYLVQTPVFEGSYAADTNLKPQPDDLFGLGQGAGKAMKYAPQPFVHF